MALSQTLSFIFLHSRMDALDWLGDLRVLVDWNNEIPKALVQTYCLVPHGEWNVYPLNYLGILFERNSYVVLDSEFTLACLPRTCHYSDYNLCTYRRFCDNIL